MIVARGLGRGAGRVIVAAGYGLATGATPSPVPPSTGSGAARRAATTKQRRRNGNAVVLLLS